MKRFATKKILIVSALLLVIAGGTAYYIHNRQPAFIAHPTHPINYGPPTKEEKAEAQNNKENVIKQQQANAASNTSGKKAVTPTITNASQIQQQITINAYVGTIFEDGGSCTITMTQGGSTITKTVEAFANASTTDCSPLRLNRSDFPVAGNWQVTVAYSSSTASGTSESKTLVVQ